MVMGLASYFDLRNFEVRFKIIIYFKGDGKYDDKTCM